MLILQIQDQLIKLIGIWKMYGQENAPTKRILCLFMFYVHIPSLRQFVSFLLFAADDKAFYSNSPPSKYKRHDGIANFELARQNNTVLPVQTKMRTTTTIYTMCYQFQIHLKAH